MRLIQEPALVPDNAEVTIHMTIRQLRIIEAVTWRLHDLVCPKSGDITRLWADAYKALGELGVTECDETKLLREIGAIL